MTERERCKNWKQSLVLVVLTTLTMQPGGDAQSTGHQLLPPCDSHIYCHGDLLKMVQMARVFNDSKHFVDMSLKKSPMETIDAFHDFVRDVGQNATKEQVEVFVRSNFNEPGSEFEPWVPDDWIPKPEFLDGVVDPQLENWGRHLHELWKSLGRKISAVVQEEPEKYSQIFVKHPVIVPGGRFREFYYWDSYWTIDGLLLSGMDKTVRGMLQNFLQMVETYGMVPNGGRRYYTRRSQPPYLIPMFHLYMEHTNDIDFLRYIVIIAVLRIRAGARVRNRPWKHRGVLRGIRKHLGGLQQKDIDEYLLELDREQVENPHFDGSWSSSDEDITPDVSDDEYLPPMSVREPQHESELEFSGFSAYEGESEEEEEEAPIVAGGDETESDGEMLKRKNVLLVSVGTEVFAVLGNICAPDLPHTKTYEQLLILLKAHYDIKPTYHRRVLAFQQKRKAGGESLKDLYADLKSLAKDCEFDARVRDQLFMALEHEVYFASVVAENLDLKSMTSTQIFERVLNLEKAFVGNFLDRRHCIFVVPIDWTVNPRITKEGKLLSVTTVHAVKDEIKVTIRDQKVPFEVDSGAAVSTVSEDWAHTLGLRVEDCKKHLKAHHNVNINVLGKVSLDVAYNDHNVSQCFYVVENKNSNLCGKDLMGKTGIYLMGIVNPSTVNKTDRNVQDLFDNYEMDPKKPISMAEDALPTLVNDDIIQSVIPTEWAAPVVTVMKSDNSVRIYGDFKELNQCLDCDQHPLPKTDELLPESEYLGYHISGEGFRPSVKKVQAILDSPSPTAVAEVQSFLSMNMYYCKFIQKFSSKCAPLYDLLKMDSKFKWSNIKQTAFETMKKDLAESPLLCKYGGESSLFVEADASPIGVGCVLLQKIDGKEVPVYFVAVCRIFIVFLKFVVNLLFCRFVYLDGMSFFVSREDYDLAENLNSEAKEQLYVELKSGAESGWDYSTRWIVNNGSNKGSLKDLRVTSIAPVDLNSLLCVNARFLSEFYRRVGNYTKEKYYDDLATIKNTTMAELFWDKADGVWYDFDIKTQQKRRYFYLSNIHPIWSGCYGQEDSRAHTIEKVISYLKMNKAIDYVGGVPTSLENSGQQWDFPNAWAPLQHILILGVYNARPIHHEAENLAFSLAEKWIRNNWLAYIQSTPSAMFEKYSVERLGLPGGGGEYNVQLGFGWSNGVAMRLLAIFGDRLTATTGGSVTVQPPSLLVVGVVTYLSSTLWQ
ncbi:uncharacterized protein [Macrobrachium rosenbergii]|uniref:uncharacterized protein n=1 Tax=Macrobrachium rosenbergii TaxID=79674 RepID=UPI0034D7B2DA